MNNTTRQRISRLSNHELMERTHALVGKQRTLTAELLLHLGEVDARELYHAEACSSLFTYCTEVLHFAEGAAFKRIRAARAGRRFPVVLRLLARGDLHLSAVSLLAPHLTEENHRALLMRAKHKSKREVERQVAEIAPKPPVAASIRKVRADAGSGAASMLLGEAAHPGDGTASGEQAAQSTGAAHNAPALGDGPLRLSPGTVVDRRAPARLPSPSVVTPLSSQTYRVQFTADPETVALLRRAQDLLQHQMPGGKPAAVVKLALAQLVEKLEKAKAGSRRRKAVTVPGQEEAREPAASEEGAPSAPPASAPAVPSARSASPPPTPPSARPAPPTPNTRYIPALVRRAVWERDQGRCAFLSSSGKRCSETGRIEFHHVHAFADGGRATVENLQLRCRAHNVYQSVLEEPRAVGESFAVRKSFAVREQGAGYGGPQTTVPGDSWGLERASVWGNAGG